jgi:hypothetical protein
MGLINLLTDPKNFKFYNGGQGYTGNGNQPSLTNIPYGKDRIDGGSSGQPYIQIPIPDNISNLGAANKDFILRGGTLAVENSVTDALRLTKMFGDLKSPSGLLFIAKQQLLSRTAVRTQASGKELNEGIYNPLSTIAQAGGVAFGTHLNKQSLIIPYSDVVKNNQQPEDNRLAELYRLSFTNGGKASDKLDNFILNDGNVLSYSGGPNSTLGVGRTNIRYADQRTGINNPLYNKSYFTGTNLSLTPSLLPSLPGSILNYDPVFIHDRTDIVEKKYFSAVNAFKLKKGVSQTYFNLVPSSILNFSGPFLPVETNTGNIYPDDLINNEKSVYTQGNTFPENSKRINDNKTYVYTQNDIISQTPIKGTYNTTQDFRAILRSKLEQKTPGSKQEAINTGLLTAALSYNIGANQTIEGRVNLGDPGNRSNKSYADYGNGVIDITTNKSIYPKQDAKFLGNNRSNNQGNNGDSANTSETQLGLDKINSLPIYKSGNADTSGITNDLVKFRIAVIDNKAPAYKTFVHFRAFLDSMNDSYNADWSPTKYLGRGENFYNYNGFTRQISLSWTVAAQSKQELIPMYKKLNYLASSLTPEYSPNGYMRGNMVQLTIGGYLYEQPGIITGLTYNIEENTPWDIGISSSYDTRLGTVQGDSSVKELPHVLRVTGFNFIPIHKFRPELQDYLNDYKHYIALANGNGADMNNYKSAPPTVANTVFRATDPPVNND